MRRCDYVNLNDPLYIRYHDEEWGKPEHSDRRLFEMLLLESFQAGLSWECVLNKREHFRLAFDDFDPEKVSRYSEDKCLSLMENANIIRNCRKISAVAQNAGVFLDIQREYGSFDAYIWNFTNRKTVVEDYHLRTTSPLSDQISGDLKKRGMRFVGSTIIYSHLQAVGMIDGHGAECELCKNIPG